MTGFKNFITESSGGNGDIGMKIVRVDSKTFRNTSLPHEEFCTVAIHEDFPDAIAKNEIWVDSSVSKKELPHIVSGAMARIKHLRKGDSSIRSYKNGLAVDAKGRHGQKVKKKHYVSLSDPKGKINVFFVSGFAVRSSHKTGFSQGGHGYVYKWIPKDEIWIEDEEREEVAPILAHEYVEMAMMRDLGIPYEDAHAIASKVEKHFRERGFNPRDYKRMTDNIGLLVGSPKRP